MAGTEEGSALTAQHRSRQLVLRSALIRDLLLTWRLFDPTDPASYAEFSGVAEILIRSLYRDSAALATTYYREFRQAERIAGAAVVRPAPELARERIRIALRATGLAGTLKAMRLGYPPEAAAQQGFVRASGAAGRLVLEGGRQSLLETVEADPERPRWRRVTSGDACHFCAMLASRGAVYASDRTAGFQAHDFCTCSVEPAFAGSEDPPTTRRFRALWTESTRGHSGADAINAFRDALAQSRATG